MNNVLKQSEDTIDLRELFQSIIAHKILIIVLTSGITLFGVIYAFVKTPTYEVKAILEIGSYSDNTLLENPSTLIKRLEIRQFVNKKPDDQCRLGRVFVVKGSENLLELVVIAPSNEEAIKKLDLLISEIQERHQNLLNSYLLAVKNEIKKLEQQREILSNEKQNLLNSMTKKIEILDRITKENPVMAAIYMIDLNNKALTLSDLNNKIFIELNNQIRELELTISSQSIKSTGIIEQVVQVEESSKSKKVGAIISIAFASGLCFSIFVALFLALRSRKDG